VDSDGETIDFLLTAKRDAAAALRFFCRAIRQHGEPKVVTIDKSSANTAALAELNAGRGKDDCIKVRQSKNSSPPAAGAKSLSERRFFQLP
jgi:transposase-like protein